MASRKKSKRAKGKRGANSKGSAPLFARSGVDIPKGRLKQIQRAARKRPKPQRDPAEIALEQKRGAIARILIRRGVPSHVAEEITSMDPGSHYYLEIWGIAGSDPHSIEYEIPVKQAVFVGDAERLWGLTIGYASKADIQHVEIKELERWIDSTSGDPYRPLFSESSVTTIDGVRVRGHGNLAEWNARQRGPKKRGGGGMTAEEKRTKTKQRNAAIKRRTKLAERIEQIRRKYPKDIARAKIKALSARSERARKKDIL